MLAKSTRIKVKMMFASLLLGISLFFTSVGVVSAASNPCDAPSKGDPTCCGKGDNAYMPSIDLGCKAQGDGPILDLLFATVRFLSYGIGLVIVGSLTYAGIQYIGSRGDPNATALAMKRVQSNVTALLLFLFAYAIVNYIVPGALLS